MKKDKKVILWRKIKVFEDYCQTGSIITLKHSIAKEEKTKNLRVSRSLFLFVFLGVLFGIFKWRTIFDNQFIIKEVGSV